MKHDPVVDTGGMRKLLAMEPQRKGLAQFPSASKALQQLKADGLISDEEHSTQRTLAASQTAFKGPPQSGSECDRRLILWIENSSLARLVVLRKQGMLGWSGIAEADLPWMIPPVAVRRCVIGQTQPNARLPQFGLRRRSV